MMWVMDWSNVTGSEEDFDTLGWHDVAVHAIALEPATTHPGSLAFDLDYIVEWIASDEPGGPYRFRIAPATLVFPMASNISLTASTESMVNQLEINEIIRVPIDVPSGAHGFFHWTVAGQNFNVEFDARGFKQHFRRDAIVVVARA